MSTPCLPLAEAMESRRLFAAAVALTANNALIEFDTDRPGVLTRGVNVTGLATGDSLASIDYRPATGVLYGLGTSNRLYVLNTETGAATQVGGALAIPILGSETTIDFNPFADALRVVTTGDQNLRINVNTGAVVDANANAVGVQADGELQYVGNGDAGSGLDPVIAGAAYSANFSGTRSTTLYAIDTQRDTLVIQGSFGGNPTSPNTGTLFTVGALGVDMVSPSVAMDIRTTRGGSEAYVAAATEGSTGTQLYNVDLTTGQATLIGTSGINKRIVGLSFKPQETQVLALGSSNRLIRFSATNPNAQASSVRVRLPAGQTLVAIDFQPRTNALIGLGVDDDNVGQLYRINPTTGRVDAFEQSIAPPLNGTSFALDFNPFANAIRITSDTGQNLRVNATTGAIVQADTNLAFASGQNAAFVAPTVTALGYANNVDLTPSTSLFGIDTANDILVTQGSLNSAPVSPNAGQLFSVGPIGFNVATSAGMDVVTRNGINRALAILQPANGTARAGLYDVNLFNGRTVRIGSLPRGVYSDVAIIPDAVLNDFSDA
jgi:hypothetical protein